jgi:hypothetical protein
MDEVKEGIEENEEVKKLKEQVDMLVKDNQLLKEVIVRLSIKNVGL